MAGYSPPWVQRAPPYGTYAEPQRITTLHVTDGFSPPAPAHSTAELGIPYRHRRAPGMRSVCTCCQVQGEQCRYPPAPCLRFHTSIPIISYRLLGWSGRRVTRDHFLLNGTGEKCRPGTQILCVSRQSMSDECRGGGDSPVSRIVSYVACAVLSQLVQVALATLITQEPQTNSLAHRALALRANSVRSRRASQHLVQF